MTSATPPSQLSQPLPTPPVPKPPPPSNATDIRTCTFNRSCLDRLNNQRRSRHFAETHVSDPSSLFLVFSPSLQVLTVLKPTPTLLLLTREQLPPAIIATLSVQPATHCASASTSAPTTDPPVLVLGRNPTSAISHVAVRLPSEFADDRICAPWLAALDLDCHPNVPKFIGLRRAVPALSERHAAMAAHARALFEFHARHAFCGVCGSSTHAEQGGSRRRCTRNHASVEPTVTGDVPASREGDAPPCNGMWFPRTDPVVIMLVVDTSGHRALLGRQSRFAPSMYSCLAGFMEHGEGVDDAVRREVAEEAGVTVGRVRMFGSQAWPFPFSLMLGCIAQVEADTSTEIVVDKHELEHAQWFTREQVSDMVMLANGNVRGEDNNVPDSFITPPRSAIAGQMLAAFAEQDDITTFTATTSHRSAGL